jgi:hypothetical protein
METTDWRESLPEQLRDAPFLGKAENLDDAVGKLAHAAQVVGTSIRIPNADASDEAKAEFYGKLADVPGVARLPTPEDAEGMADIMSKLGRPEKAEDYLPAELEGHQWDDGALTDLKAYAHEAGMTNSQFQTLAQKVAEQQLSTSTATQQAQQEQRELLAAEWGEALPQNELLVKNWLEASGAPEAMRDMLEGKTLTAESLKWLHQTATQFMSEANPVNRDGASPTATVSPTEASARIGEILNNPAYFDSGDPRQADLRAQMLKYQALANPPAQR